MNQEKVYYLLFHSYFPIRVLILLFGDAWSSVKIRHNLLLPLKLGSDYENKKQKNKQHWS